MNISKRNKPILGLDIGSYSIKAVVLNSGKSGLVLNTLGVVNLPPDAILDGKIEDRAAVVQAIVSLLKSQKSKVKNVSTSVSGYSVIIKKINLPTASREELSESINVYAEQYIPFDINDVNVDFEILGQSETDEGQMEVVLVAAMKDVIDEYMDLLLEANLTPKVVDIDVFALENSFSCNYPEIKGTVVLIDIGANKLNINVIKDGISLFTRDASMGGARITEEIQDRFGVDFMEAEGMKAGGIEPPEAEAMEEIISRAIENWTAEVIRAIESLGATYPEDKIEEIYLSGGSCRYEGLDRYLSQETGIPVKFFDPLLNIAVDEKKFDPEYIKYIAPQFAICLGLALRMGEES